MSIIFDALKKVQREKKKKTEGTETQPAVTQASTPGPSPESAPTVSASKSEPTLRPEPPRTVSGPVPDFDKEPSPPLSALPPLPEIIFDEHGPAPPQVEKKKFGGKTPLLVGAAILVIVVGGGLATRTFLGSKRPAPPVPGATKVALAPSQPVVPPLEQKAAAPPPQPALIPQPEPPSPAAPPALESQPVVPPAPGTEPAPPQATFEPPAVPPPAAAETLSPAPLPPQPAFPTSFPPPQPQLPGEVTLPKLKINILRPASAIHPQPRAVVNLQPVGEGDGVDGAKVIKINPADIEFEFQGQRFTVKF